VVADLSTVQQARALWVLVILVLVLILVEMQHTNTQTLSIETTLFGGRCESEVA
jgi:hypothetical protein